MRIFELIVAPIVGFNVIVMRQQSDKRVASLLTTQVQLMIGATDSSKYVAPLLLYSVVKTKDVSQYLLFMISMGPVRVVQPGVSMFNSASIGNIEFSNNYAFIYLNLALVDTIVSVDRHASRLPLLCFSL